MADLLGIPGTGLVGSALGVGNEVSEVQTALDTRKEELSSATSAISLLQGAQDIMGGRLGDVLKGNLPSGLTGLEVASAASKAQSIITKMMQVLPTDLTNNHAIEAMLSNQLSVMSQQMFMSGNAAKNAAGLYAKAKDALLPVMDEFVNTVDGLSGDTLGRLGNIQSVLQSGATGGFNLQSLGSSLTSIIPGPFADLKDKTNRLQARILGGGDFSAQRIMSIMSSLDGMKISIPAELQQLAPILAGGCSYAESLVTGAQYKMNDILQRLDNMKSFPEDLVQSIRPGDMFNRSFSQIRDMYESMESQISQLQSGVAAEDICTIVPAIEDYVGKVNGLMGIFQTLGNREFMTAMLDPANEYGQKMQGFADLIKGGITEQMTSVFNDTQSLVRDAKATFNMVRGIIDGSFSSLSTVTSMMSRVSTITDSIKSGISTVKNLLNTFDVVPEADVNAFMASVGQTAPAAQEAILTGNLKSFEKTIANPQNITKYGQAVTAIKQYMTESRDKLTVDSAGQLGLLSSVMTGMHRRQLNALWLVNLPLQRSQLLKEFKIYAKSFIEPTEQLYKNVVATLPKGQ